MKVLQPIFLGGVGGLALTLAIAIGLYLSPLRKDLFLAWDPELAGLRDRTEHIRERMQAGELGMAEGASSAAHGAGAAADSLRRAQAGAWKEYRHWRNRLGERARAHDVPGPAAFPDWAYSLRYVLGPLAALLFLAPALFFSIRAVRAARSPRDPARGGRSAMAAPKAPPRPQPAPAEALSSFQSAVKQVARIAAAPLPPAARPVADPRAAPPRAVSDSRPAAGAPLPDAGALSDEPSPYDVASDHAFRAPEADSPPGAGPRPDALETQVLNLGPGGWGEPRFPAGPDATARPGDAGALSMEDEDGEAQPKDGAQGHFMPPTTEVERVERRKAEVVKLARKGMTSSEISRRLRISQDQVDFILRMRREKG